MAGDQNSLIALHWNLQGLERREVQREFGEKLFERRQKMACNGEIWDSLGKKSMINICKVMIQGEIKEKALEI